MNEKTANAPHRHILLAFYTNQEKAKSALQSLADQDLPLDRASLLGKASSSGDDPLGVYYSDAGERMRGWGKMGAFWGGLWGLVTGAAGMFLVPGVGPLLAAGPVVEALVGAAGGAAITGGVLAGSGAVSQLAVAVHRLGVPEQRIQETHERIQRGQLLLMLIVAQDEVTRWRPKLEPSGADTVWDFPYYGLGDAAKERLER
jgi:hypothetical protein